MEIIELDVQDTNARRTWFQVELETIRHDRPFGWERTHESFEQSVLLGPNPYNRIVQLGALSGSGDLLGIAELAMSLQDNTHLANVDLSVHPEHRRAGVGSALFREVERLCAENGRSTLCAEVYFPTGSAPEESPGVTFANRFGFASVHREDHLVLDLPVPAERLGELDIMRTGSTAYDVVMWGERCPEEHVEAFCTMRTQMAQDVPTGDIDFTPHVMDETRLRTNEARLAAGWISIVAAARRRSDGVMAGYSVLVLPRGGTLAMQDDTLVMPEHRGHRLGTLLKLSTLEVLARDHPQRRALHTWTEPDNHAMYRTNTDFGYVARERMHEVQRQAARP